MDDREVFVKGIIKDKDSRILEIGPLNRPIVLKSEYKNSFYCDIRNTEEIKKLYSGNEYMEKTGIYIDINSIADVDFVINENYQKTFSNMEKFDYVVASHVLEHMEDIIGFFVDISGILKPGGKLCIIYPDKRYCFDHFRESSSFRDAFDVFTRGETETARMVLDFFSMSINENNPMVFWNEYNLNNIIPQNSIDRSIKNYKRALNGEKLDDVHYWPFTDRSFLLFMYNCLRAKLMPFSCSKFIPTKENTQQFFAELEYDRALLEDNLPELKNLQALISSVPKDYHNSEDIRKETAISELSGKVTELTTQVIGLENSVNELKDKNASLENECNLLKSHNEELKGFINEVTIQNTALSDIIKELTLQNASMEENNRQLNSKNMELMNREIQLMNEIDKLTGEIELMKLEKNDIMNQLDGESKQLNAALSALEEIYESRTWKATKPVRLFLDSIKKIIKKSK